MGRGGIGEEGRGKEGRIDGRSKKGGRGEIGEGEERVRIGREI